MTKALFKLSSAGLRSQLQVVVRLTWLMCSATFLRAAKHIPPNSKGLRMKIWRGCILASSQASSHWSTAGWRARFHWRAGRRGKGKRKEGREEPHAGTLLPSNFFLCLLLTDQSKGKLKENASRQRNKKNNKLACLFLEQNKLSGTAKNKFWFHLWDSRKSRFQCRFARPPLLLSLFGCKRIAVC